MKKGMILLLCLALLLCGCGKEAKETPVSSSIWETMPALTYGSLEYEKLEPEAWYCGRCEATGGGKWAETDLGYYFMYDFNLFYADKEDLSNWVPLCNQPDCKHSATWSYGQPVCNAQVSGNSFLLLDGRIYSETSSDFYPELKLSDGSAHVLFSRAADGTDRRREYYVADTVSQGGGARSTILNYQYWLQAVSLFNPDGSYTQRLYCTTKDGEYLLTEFQMEEMFSHIVSRWGMTDKSDGIFSIAGPNGDPTFFTTLFGDMLNVVYRIRDGEVEAPDIMDYATQWKYLSGDVLRIFRADDGLYDVNIQTKEEVKVADITGKRGIAVMLPNCMIAYGTDGTMELFDGAQWRDIQLPEGMGEDTPGIGCVASDRILFLNNGEKECRIYQVMLDREDLVMEFCGTKQKLP